MSATEIVVVIVFAIIAALALCWFAVEVAVRRVRRDRTRHPESIRHGGI